MLNIGIIAHLRHAIKEPFAGGLEMHTQALCQGLRAKGHRVSLFAASDSADPGLEPMCPAVPLDDRTFSSEHRQYRALMDALACRSFDLIHNNSLHYLPVAMAAALPMPMITTLHTPPFWELEGSMRLNRTLKHRVVAVSDVIRRAWQPIVPVECVVANGIDLERFRFREVPDAEPYVIWYGRIVPEKGLHLAIEAARFAGLPLRFAGPIADRTYYDQHILPKTGREVRYLGHLSHNELVAAIGGARAFLCTPLWEEPYGLVVAEALACGTPVAAFARGAVPDLLDFTCGALVDAADAKGLAAAALSVQRLARAACRARAEAIGDARTMIDRYGRLYADMIRRHPLERKLSAQVSTLASIAPTNAALIDTYARATSTMVCRLPAGEFSRCP